MVDGRVLAEDLQSALAQRNPNAYKYMGIVALYAATQFQTPKAGPVTLRLSGAEKTPVWIDGKAVTASTSIQADLAPGTHTVVLRLDPKSLPDQVRLESPDATFAAD